MFAHGISGGVSHPMDSGRFSELFKQAFGDYISYLQLVLEIQDWRIVLLADYPDGTDVSADIKCVYGQRIAELRLAKGFHDEDPVRLRHVIVHELVHILTDGCDNVIDNGLDILLGKPAFTVLKEAFDVQVEYLTDQLAYVIDELLDGRAIHDRRWENVLRAERDELPLPDPDTRVS